MKMEFEKLQKLIADIVSVEPEEVVLSKNLVEDFGGDALSIFQILMGLEAEFGLVIEEADGRQWKTVEDVWDYLQKR